MIRRISRRFGHAAVSAFGWCRQSAEAISAVEPDTAVFARHMRHGGVDDRLRVSSECFVAAGQRECGLSWGKSVGTRVLRQSRDAANAVGSNPAKA